MNNRLDDACDGIDHGVRLRGNGIPGAVVGNNIVTCVKFVERCAQGVGSAWVWYGCSGREQDCEKDEYVMGKGRKSDIGSAHSRSVLLVSGSRSDIGGRSGWWGHC